ncbi:MAG: nicotinate-nucleotide adenylyltransferase [Candidatus Marsarchaeota archaeon]|nr:nicotinate-nucleotide adenylyltransferase [Candidatus Marsarchaeota archaeon]
MVFKYVEGSVHGRFQPLHNDHMEYILAAKAECQYLWIGITQYNVRKLDKSPEDVHRQVAENNPLTYAERVQLISEALLDAGLARSNFGFVPFPIEVPDLLPDFVPRTVPCFTTVYDEWNRRKVERLRNLGYEVIVLWERDRKRVVGNQVRESIRVGKNDWIRMVPAATVSAVSRWELRRRLVDLHELGDS